MTTNKAKPSLEESRIWYVIKYEFAIAADRWNQMAGKLKC